MNLIRKPREKRNESHKRTILVDKAAAHRVVLQEGCRRANNASVEIREKDR